MEVFHGKWEGRLHVCAGAPRTRIDAARLGVPAALPLYFLTHLLAGLDVRLADVPALDCDAPVADLKSEEAATFPNLNDLCHAVWSFDYCNLFLFCHSSFSR